MKWPRTENPNPTSGTTRMASSRVMASSSSRNSEIASKSSLCSPAAADAPSFASIRDPRKSFGSLSIEDLLGNIYGDNSTPIANSPYANRAELVNGVGVKTKEEVWTEITAGSSGSESKEDGEMTLEDFLAKAGAVMENPVLGFRRRHPFNVLDKVAVRRQKRMIKNRESAARSRERKLAYTAELESLVLQLEEENAQLHAIMVERNKQRLKELMEKDIPVTLKKNTPRQLTKTRSMEW